MKEVWWLSENALSSAFYRKKDRRLKDGKGKGFRVFLCKECNRAYENVYAEGSARSLFYYEDFPRYGLEKYQCPECGNRKGGR